MKINADEGTKNIDLLLYICAKTCLFNQKNIDEYNVTENSEIYRSVFNIIKILNEYFKNCVCSDTQPYMYIHTGKRF